MSRILTPYEQTHLARFSQSPVNLSELGEMPVEYFTGKVEFAGQVFEISTDALIPRLETEELVAIAVKKILALAKQNPNQIVELADIGTGCGAIGLSVGLALIKDNIKFHLTLSDISPAALGLAEKNLHQLIPTAWRSSFAILESDLLNNFPIEQKYDLFIANLPYIPSGRIAFLDTSVKDFEPYIALNGGASGLDIINSFLSQAQSSLSKNGQILLEIDYTHTDQDLVANFPNLKAEMIFDQFQRQRFAVVTCR